MPDQQANANFRQQLSSFWSSGWRSASNRASGEAGEGTYPRMPHADRGGKKAGPGFIFKPLTHCFLLLPYYCVMLAAAPRNTPRQAEPRVLGLWKRGKGLRVPEQTVPRIPPPSTAQRILVHPSSSPSPPPPTQQPGTPPTPPPDTEH